MSRVEALAEERKVAGSVWTSSVNSEVLRSFLHLYPQPANLPSLRGPMGREPRGWEGNFQPIRRVSVSSTHRAVRKSESAGAAR